MNKLIKPEDIDYQIDDVLKILREEKVDSDIIGRIIGLKEENQG